MSARNKHQPDSSGSFAFEGLQRLIHERARLSILSSLVAHPNGRGFLERDARNVAAWFAARGLPGADPERLARLLAEEARLA